MIRVKDILSYLEKLYPPDTACEFDNVGLLVGDKGADVSGVVVALDCDITTLKAAEQKGANLIVTHHPVIFEPVKSVTADNTVYKLIKSGISVISMHTNLDVGGGGVNDTLCDILQLKGVKPYIAEDGYMLRLGKTGYNTADDFAAFIKERLGGAVRYVDGGKPIKSVLVCSGSGGGYLAEAIENGFDALITADIKHNYFIDAINAGISLFDGGHYNTENIIVLPLCDRLKHKFPDIECNAHIPNNIKTL